MICFLAEVRVDDGEAYLDNNRKMFDGRLYPVGQHDMICIRHEKDSKSLIAWHIPYHPPDDRIKGCPIWPCCCVRLGDGGTYRFGIKVSSNESQFNWEHGWFDSEGNKLEPVEPRNEETTTT